MTIAQQIIDEWLKDGLGAVKYEHSDAPPQSTRERVNTARRPNKESRNKTIDRLHNNDLLTSSTEWNGDSENTDYISGTDFVNTDISHCVEQVMAGMFTRPLDSDILKMTESNWPTASNPAITMEMRHKQVCLTTSHYILNIGIHLKLPCVVSLCIHGAFRSRAAYYFLLKMILFGGNFIALPFVHSG